jgi:hypothetical protein
VQQHSNQLKTPLGDELWWSMSSLIDVLRVAPGIIDTEPTRLVLNLIEAAPAPRSLPAACKTGSHDHASPGASVQSDNPWNPTL